MSVTYIYPPVDANPTDLYNGFVAFMQEWIPGWEPFSGELDDWLARAFTAIAAQLQEITSDVATSIFRWFGAYIVNVPPLDAAPASGTVTITVQDTAGYTIPAYTHMSFPNSTGVLQGFQTLTDTVIAPGSSSATGVLVQAMTAGSAGNGCSGAGDLDQSTPITFITGLSMAASSSGGTDAEDDATYLTRLTQLFTTLTPSPITVADFTAIALQQSGVGRAVTIGAFNPGTWTTSGTLTTSSKNVTVASTANIPVGAPVSGTGVPSNTFVTGITSGTVFTISQNATATGAQTLTISGQLNQGGYVTTWVTDSSGNALTSPAMSTITSAIQAECLANVTYTTEAPTSTTVNVTASVLAWPGQDPTAIQTAVQSALTTALEPANFGQMVAGTALNTGLTLSDWLNDTKIRVSTIEYTIMSVIGVHDVTSLTLSGSGTLTPVADSSGNLLLGGVVPLPTPGTMTITVTNG